MTEQTHNRHSTKRLPVPVKEYYNAHEAAYLLQISKDKVYDLARLPGDPLRAWMERNSILFSERNGR